MQYLKFSPCKQLEPFIECYFIWQTVSGPVQNMVVESPPTGFCSIVFNSGDPYFLHNKKYEKLEVPEVFVAGQAIYSYKLFLNGCISMAGIVFKPAGLASLFSLPVYEFTEERIALEKILKESIVAKLSAALKQQSEPVEKAKLLEAFVLHQAGDIAPEPDAIDEAANKIVLANGLLHVNDLIEQAYMSRRNFERKFFKKVGLSPKYYARIRRMSYIGNLIAGKAKVDWPEVFHNCEYYDQSHFIKDFIEFTGRTPQQYFEENRELSKYVDKPTSKPLD
jgi:AraC-like DNA-binding protein